MEHFEKIKYKPVSIRDLLVGMKDLSELMIDLAYSAALFHSHELAEDVLDLEKIKEEFEEASLCFTVGAYRACASMCQRTLESLCQHKQVSGLNQLKEDGMSFLIDLVGSPKEGLKQIFSKPSINTLLVNEYIHRYGDFDGFFTKKNVTLLTAATKKQ